MNTKHFSLIVFSFYLFLANSSVLAAEKLNQSGIWGGVELGGGNVRTLSDGGDKNEFTYYLGFKVGYRVNTSYLVGLELGGWSIESGNLRDPSKGEAISQTLIISQFYPNKSLDIFMKLGIGYVSHWNNRPGEPQKKSGWGVTLGGGNDFSLFDDWAITPFVTISHAETDGERHNSWALGIGVAYSF